METPIGTAFITVNETPGGDPFEVFVQVGKAGSDTMAVAEALGRLISLVLRLPSPLSAQRRLEEVINQLSLIGGGQPTGFGAAKILSLPDALARTLGEHIGLGRRQGGGARPGRGGGAARAGGAAPGRRPLQGVRAGDPGVRRRLQEVPVLRLQRMLASRDSARHEG
jgi:ribonucleoside-diphosphate reductase alpha chain